MTVPDIAALHAALAARPAFAGVRPGDLEPLAVPGIAHDHVRVNGVRIDGCRPLLRVPRLSQWGLAPADNLAYQSACFERAWSSGHTPRLLAVLPVTAALPMGALVVEEIAGAKPRLPRDLDAIAGALARLHGLGLPPAAARPPLRSDDDPVAATLTVIETQAAYLDAARLAPETRAPIETDLAWARGFAARARERDHPVALVGTDTHPGNFLIEARGGERAVLVDLEKALYGSPAIDLAHATLYTSTRWDPDCDSVLTADQTAGFYRAYLAAAGAAAADRLRPWLAPMRRLTWLRTVTWCARWRVLSARPAPTGAGGDWSAARMGAAFRRHTEAVVADFFAPATVARVRAEWLEDKSANAFAAALTGRCS